MGLLALLQPLQGHAEIRHQVDAAGFSFSFVISLNVEFSFPILPLRNLEAGIYEAHWPKLKASHVAEGGNPSFWEAGN